MFINSSGRKALNMAFEYYGVEKGNIDQLRNSFETILEEELEFYIHHEIGEMKDKEFDPHVWRNILAEFPHTPIELVVRAVKDMLADTGNKGAINYLTEYGLKGPLYLYVASLDGIRRRLFPEILDAICEFYQKNDWGIIYKAVEKGYQRSKELAHRIVDLYTKEVTDNPNHFEKRIKNEILQPLGLGN